MFLTGRNYVVCRQQQHMAQNKQSHGNCTRGERKMPAKGPSRQLRRMQWIAIILVTAAIALNYMDRSTLAIGNLRIRQEFGINATAIGALG
jgi:hypothetical protein